MFILDGRQVWRVFLTLSYISYKLCTAEKRSSRQSILLRFIKNTCIIKNNEQKILYVV